MCLADVIGGVALCIGVAVSVESYVPGKVWDGGYRVCRGDSQACQVPPCSWVSGVMGAENVMALLRVGCGAE